MCWKAKFLLNIALSLVFAIVATALATLLLIPNIAPYGPTVSLLGGMVIGGFGLELFFAAGFWFLECR